MRITRSGLFSDLTGSGVDLVVQPSAPIPGADAGTLTIKARDAGVANFGGAIAMACGSGANGGAFSIASGAGGNVGGDFLLTAGDATAAGATAGSFLMSAGFTYGAGGTGGSFLMQAGGGDTTGSIYLATPLGNGMEITDDGASVKVGLWGATPTKQATTAIAGAAFVAGAGTAVNSNSTFGGYTLAQIAAALVAIGVLV